jgi:glycosyltransferase involved in cell wall biosynthesis
MKVLHVIPALAPRYGGPSSSIVEMCLALKGAGATPLIATTNADGESVLDVPLNRTTDWKGTPAIFFQRQWSEAFKYSHGLGSWLERNVAQFDIVHIHGPLSYSSLAAAGAAHRQQVPFVVRPLGTLDRWSLQQKTRKKQLLMPFVARMLRRAAAIHCTSAEELRDVSATFKIQNGVVIPLGVQPGLFREKPLTDESRESDRYVLALSRLHPVKNLESLVEAFADFDALGKRNGWRLVIGGSGDDDYAAAIDAAVSHRDAGRFITRVGWMGGDAKRMLVRHASLFALPSHHENFGVGLIEAMAAGVPAVVGQGVHLAADIGRAGAGWIVDGTPQSICSALIAATADEQPRRRMAERARTFAASFAWPAVAAQLVGLYDRILAQRARGAA